MALTRAAGHPQGLPEDDTFSLMSLLWDAFSNPPDGSRNFSFGPQTPHLEKPVHSVLFAFVLLSKTLELTKVMQ